MSPVRDNQGGPPGWIWNPSTWSQRIPIVALACVGALVAGYLALWQYNVIDTVWEPIFRSSEGEPNGTETILASPLSNPFRDLLGLKWLPFPISDALLGMGAYIIDAVTGMIGGQERWRRRPWIVVIFATFVGPLGGVSLALVIAQPLVEGAWCTLCLLSAIISVLMVGPAMDEALASCQHLGRVARDPERSAWRAFWGLDDRS